MPNASTVDVEIAPRRLHYAQLLRASKLFAHDVRWLSWFHLVFALVAFSGLLALAGPRSLPWLVRIPASLLAGFVLVRLFIIYHDFQHGTILKGSRLAGGIMTLYGLLTLNPRAIWVQSHNHHHKHNAKILGASIGSYPVMTVRSYARATRGQRALYAATRHPLTIAAGYFTVFFYGMSLRPLLLNPRANLGPALSLVIHLSVGVLLALHGWDTLLLAMIVPCSIASAIGAYLFYAQHNYPSVALHDRAAWDYVGAALESSSYIRMGHLMAWCTGNIGYHHVHHLNARIPFYRLPEAMAALPDLQMPGLTSLSLRDIIRCFRLKLWDPALGRMVAFPAGAAE